jgi:hypothetical protein
MASHSKSGHAAHRDPETNRRETLQPADGYGAPVPAGRLSVVLQTSAFCSLRWGAHLATIGIFNSSGGCRYGR